MVGVPGKYKGCETCRRRRVKCSNERPFCNNCVNSGRQCQGYEREHVFITGTPETKGRVASHPKRTSSASKPKAAAAGRTDDEPKPPLAPAEPLASAWDDSVTLVGPVAVAPVLVTALHTDLWSVVKREGAADAHFDVMLPAYLPSDPRLRAGAGQLSVRASCLVRLGHANAEPGYCAFLYEHDSAAAEPNPVAVPGLPSIPEVGSVRRLGPENFTIFPNHQYFMRIFRPTAISHALLGRRPTFLSEQGWTSTPWSWHTKSPFDHLIDIVLRLPPVLAAADGLLPQPATLTRRLEAQGLLQSCLIIELQIHEWLQGIIMAAGTQQPPYWYQQLGECGGEIPFADLYAFRDGLTALMMLYLWMAQIPLHGCIGSLHNAIFQPVIDAYPDMWPDLPPSLQIDPTNYQDGCGLAANICRGLDAALEGTTQPDLLLGPIAAALNVYSGASQSGLLEMLWLEAFQKRLIQKGQQIANILQQQRWVELARY